MAEASDLSRTEPATPRRLQAAREAGDVPRSREWAGWVTLLAALGMLSWQAPRLFEALQGVIQAAFRHAAQPLAPPLIEAVVAALWSLLPVLVAVFVAALLAPMLLSGWVYAPQRTQAVLARANPAKPFARLISADAWFDGGLAVFKLALIATAVGWALASGWPMLDALNASVTASSAWLWRGMLALAAALALAAVLDAGWRWWRYLRRHAMTWQEVLAEAREAELPPEVQAQLRARQQQAGQGRGTLPNPLPPAGAGANAQPRTIDEVID